jgi:putative hydrolase of the HAD superfamily
MTRALLLDLDDTIIVEEPAAVAAFAATARVAAERHPLDAKALALDARARAREIWRAAPHHAFCRRIGVSSWEGLFCRYEGDGDELAALRAWAPGYRREAWRRALAGQGVEDDALAEELGERFGADRRALHETFADAAPALDALAADHVLALVTNGASCWQREKLAASGLADRFAVVVVSGELGTAKPDPAVYTHALSALGAEPGDAVMAGDSLRNDVDGALAAGLAGAVWVNRDRRPCPDGWDARAGRLEVRDLAELCGLLATAPRSGSALPRC